MSSDSHRSGFTLIEVTLSTLLGIFIVGLVYSAVQTTVRAASAARVTSQQIALLDMAFAQLQRGADAMTLTSVTLMPSGNPFGRPVASMTRQAKVSGAATTEVLAGVTSTSTRTLAYLSTVSLGTDPITGITTTTWMAAYGAR